MDLVFSAEDQTFREEVRTWLREHVPRAAPPDDGRAMREFDLAWQAIQYEGGWAGIAWPTAYGGRGLSLTQQLIWHEEYALADAPDTNSCFVGLNHAGPTLMDRGNDKQKAFHLPRILRGEVVWCQGFSEPNAGSDLASLQCRAVVDGDELVVSGQKIWTSHANLADYQELLVRTDPTAPKHKGITWIIGDMHAPGIDIRPIEAIAGDHHFCEVFYDEVRLPLANVVGDVDDGWSVAMSTLAYERGTAFMAEQVRLARTVEALIDVARETPGPDGRTPAIADEHVAHELASLRAEVAALRAMTYASVSRVAARGKPGPEGSLVRLYLGECMIDVARVAVDVLGPELLVLAPFNGQSWTKRYLTSMVATTGGGTHDIQRDIVGERVLGLPRAR